MSNDFPINTIFQIIAVMLVVAVGSWLILSLTLRDFPASDSLKRAWRWGAAILLAIWLLGRVALSISPPGGGVLPTAYLITFLVAGISVGTLPLMFSPVYRQFVRAIPPTWLVGIQAVRIGGTAFLTFLDMKLLPAEFALPAGYGDITVGVLALVVLYLLARKSPYARSLLVVWNLLGLLDFMTALVTGITFIAPFVTPLAQSGVSLSYLNYVFIIPSFGVPLFTILHIYSLHQIFAARREARAEKVALGVQP